MLNLSNLRSLLLQVLSLPSLHTAVLFTPEGHLVSYASDPSRPKDEVRVVVGLSGDIWQETKEHGIGMVESELGRLLVTSVEPPAQKDANGEESEEPILLLALNGDATVSWKEMERKAQGLISHLQQPVIELHKKLAAAPASPIASTQRPTRLMSS